MAQPIRDFILGLDNRIAQQVFEYLGPKELATAKAVSRAWRSIDIEAIQIKQFEYNTERLLNSLGIRRFTREEEWAMEERIAALPPISQEEKNRMEEKYLEAIAREQMEIED